MGEVPSLSPPLQSPVGSACLRPLEARRHGAWMIHSVGVSLPGLGSQQRQVEIGSGREARKTGSLILSFLTLKVEDNMAAYLGVFWG